MSQSEDDNFEPVPGLPEPLPAGEHILWQGKPDWRAIAVDVFHVRAVAIYGALMLAWHVTGLAYDGMPLAGALATTAKFVPLLAFALGLFALFAWLTAGTTLYTITERRLVLRIGIVLTMSVNIPFRIVENAAVRRSFFGTTDIALTVAGPGRISYVHLWPHARPWRMARPEPSLRALPDGERVADILARALLADTARRGRETQSVNAGIRLAPRRDEEVRGTGTPVGAAG